MLALEIYTIIHNINIGIIIESTVNIIAIKLGILKILIIVYIDLFSLYECLVKLGTTKEKRLIINIISLR